MEFPTSLRSAGKKIADTAASAAEAVRGLRMPGLRMPGVGAPVPAPAAPASTPLPTIDPSMADRAQAAMRAAPARSAIPTLTDVIEPGVGPVNRPPAIPTLTDVIEPGTVKPPGFNPAAGQANPSLRGGMSPERAAYNAEQAARMGPQAPATSGLRMSTLPNMPAMPNMADAARGVAKAAIINAPSKMGVISGAATGAAAALPHWQALSGDESRLTGMQQAKLALRDVSRAAGGILGGAFGAGVGSVAAPVLGTAAGGIAGGIAGYEGVDALGGGLRRGLNWANEKLGGDANYITSTDEDLRNAGYDPNASMLSAFTKGGQDLKQPATAAVVGKIPAAGTAPAAAAPATPDDIAAFNARMAEVGAKGVGLRAGTTPDSRVLFGTDAGKDAQAITDARMAQRTNAVAAQDAAANANQNARFDQLATNERMDALSRRAFDSSSYDSDIAAAKASGSAVRINQAYGAREAAQRAFSAEKQADVQAATSMRNTDVNAGAQQAQANAAAAAAARKAATDEREFGLRLAQFGLDQKKEQRAEGERDEDVLRRQGEKNMERIASMIESTGDPERDKQRVAEFQRGLPAYVAQIKEDLKQRIKVDPNNKMLQAALEGYEKRGVAHLDDADMERFVAGMEFTKAAAEYDSSRWSPMGGLSTNRIGPATSIRRDSRFFGDVYVDDSGAEVPARAIDKKDADFFFGSPNVRYNSLKDRQ